MTTITLKSLADLDNPPTSYIDSLANGSRHPLTYDVVLFERPEASKILVTRQCQATVSFAEIFAMFNRSD